MIAVVDYGAGNVCSVMHALEHIGAPSILTREERKAAAVTALPADLNAAIERMEEDPLVRNVLGSHIYEKYLAAKRTEWREYRMRVSQWELDEYLGKY